MDNFQAYGEFARVYDMFQDNVDYQTWGKWLKQQLEAQGITDGLVLDLGCGTGTMTEILAEAGYDMIGVDNSGEMLAEAMEKRVESGHDILYLLQDMQDAAHLLKVFDHSFHRVVPVGRTGRTSGSPLVQIDHRKMSFKKIAGELFEPIGTRSGPSVNIKQVRSLPLHFHIKPDAVGRRNGHFLPLKPYISDQSDKQP